MIELGNPFRSEARVCPAKPFYSQSPGADFTSLMASSLQRSTSGWSRTVIVFSRYMSASNANAVNRAGTFHQPLLPPHCRYSCREGTCTRLKRDRSRELRILDQYPVFIMLNNQHETFSGEDPSSGMRECSSLMMIERQSQIGEEESP